VLDLGRALIEIGGRITTLVQDLTMSSAGSTPSSRRIRWDNMLTVLSAAVLIGAEVFGAAFAGGWAIANLFGLGDTGVYVLQAAFFVAGIAVMISFVRNAMRVEPFLSRN
jgi:hypothetical protein